MNWRNLLDSAVLILYRIVQFSAAIFIGVTILAVLLK